MKGNLQATSQSAMQLEEYYRKNEFSQQELRFPKESYKMVSGVQKKLQFGSI